MSLSATRSLGSALSTLVRHARTVPVVSKPTTLAALAGTRALHRGFTRSMWYMCNAHRNDATSNAFKGSQATGWTKMCGCCGLHTAGDKELEEFLKEEIKLEKENDKTSGKIPQINGFEVTSTDGANVVLSRKSDNETITVRLNVNNSVDDDSTDLQEPQPDDQPPPQMVSRPPFVVEISKGASDRLCIQCMFPPHETPQGPEEEFVELIEIQDVTFLKKDQEWSDDTFSVSGSIMDGNLYDMLLNMLEERGITGEFVDQLVEFSTSYEHKNYIGFLEQLENFVACK